MKKAWFENPDNVVYADIDEFADNFGKETGIDNLREKIEAFKADPVKEGINLKGRKRTSLKLFIPNMYFEDKIEMGDTVWAYMGENYECYCLYWKE
jgi:hypothetical protein